MANSFLETNFFCNHCSSLFSYQLQKKFFKSFYNSGLSGFIGGIFLGIGFAAYVFSMYTTTVANTKFIITTETIF